MIDSKVGDPGFEALADESKVTFSTVKEDAEITVGRRTLQCIAASTPRYPELLCLYERTTRRLFSSCFFSAHVNPQQGQQGARLRCAIEHALEIAAGAGLAVRDCV